MSQKSDTFVTYGKSFQTKIISSLLTNKSYMEQTRDILDPDFLESDANKWLVKEIDKYYSEYRKLPTLDALKIIINDIPNEVLKISVIDNLKEAYKQQDASDLDFVRQRSLDFCKNQKIKDAIIQSTDLLSTGDYEGIKSIIDEAMKAGTDANVGHEYLDMIEERYSESARVTTATPWDPINEMMNGGLGGGELGVVVAPAGIGKSWILATLGAHAVKTGKKVLHYTLELNESYVGLRYDSIFTGHSVQNLSYHKDELESKLGNLDGDLVIKYFPTKGASVQTILAHAQKAINLKGDVDLIVLDYADLLRGTNRNRNEELRHQLGNIYEDLRGVAGELDIPIWTASQANRSSLEDEIIEASKIAESYNKIMTADFVLSLSRKVEDKVANTGRFHIIKNRFGPDGITLPASINTNNGQIQVFESGTQDGKQVQGKMNNHAEYARKILSKKFNELE